MPILLLLKICRNSEDQDLKQSPREETENKYIEILEIGEKDFANCLKFPDSSAHLWRLFSEENI